MRLGLAQVDATPGDLAGNVSRAARAATGLAAAGAELVLLPELMVPGPSCRDLLFDPSFVAAIGEATRDLATRTAAGPPVIAGTILPAGRATPRHPGLFNAAVLLASGDVRLAAAKRLLAAHDGFLEPRWFVPGPPAAPIEICGCRIGVLLADDLADDLQPRRLAGGLVAAGVEVLLVPAASPYRRGVRDERVATAARTGVPLAYVNLAGAVDELVYDGRSFVLDDLGRPLAELPACAEGTAVVDLGPATPVAQDRPTDEDDMVWRALVLGIRDFARKNRLQRAVVGLSGGVDSALVAVLAAEALGPERVLALAVPSRFTDPRSTAAARELASRLGIRLEVVELEPLHAACETLLGPSFGGVAAENLQARLRMLVLMAFVNRDGGFLLNTANKTEASLGYGTLYGDLAGALCPIADLTKPEVMRLARRISAVRGMIPDFALERPPSAELAAGQVDPFDYERIAPELEELVQSHRDSPLLRRSEHKRRTMGVILQVSKTAFGPGRILPLTRGGG